VVKGKEMKVKHILLLIISISWITLLNAASVEATVNTTEVIKGNSVQLRIKAIGGAAAFPTIRDIEGVQVNNGGTSRQSSMQITVNGMKQERSTVKKYSFVPNHDLTIPAYTVRIGGKNYRTKPISIKVMESNAPQITNDNKFSFVLKSNKNSVYVGESFVLTVYISASDKLQGAQIGDYTPPTASGFFIKETGKQKKYQNNGYITIEQRYILTAKKEGNFTISPASVKLGMPDRSRQDIFGRYGTSWTNVVSNALDIEVKGLKSDADLIGDFSVESIIDAQKVKANKPINFTVTIRGKGNLEDFEFQKYEIDGVTIYSDEAKVESHLDGSELISSYSKSFAFIAEDDFTIPARTISMYNPQTQESKTLEIPEYNITIAGKKSFVSTPSMEQISIKPEKVTSEIIEKKVEVKTIAWWMLVLAFILGAFMMYLLRFLPKLWTAKQKSYKESEALKILYAHISEGSDVEEMVRKLYAKKSGDKSVIIDKKELKAMMENFI